MEMATPAEFAGAPTSPPPSGFTGFLPGFFFCVHWSIVIVLMSLQWLSVDVIHQCKLNELDNGNGVRLKKKNKK